MMENNKVFWIAAFVSGLVGLYWSVMFALSQPAALYIAFAAVNGLCLLTNVVCLILNLRWNKK